MTQNLVILMYAVKRRGKKSIKTGGMPGFSEGRKAVHKLQGGKT